MSLEQLIAVFEKMCRSTFVKDEMILFETGTYDFSGEPRFCFSLVRQYPNDEEYYQIHMDVRYLPNEENEKYTGSIWDEDIEQNIFDYIRKSGVYQMIMNENYVDVDIYLDET